MKHPEWWEWELEISTHCLKRMHDRQFNEADLRMMLEDATDWVLQMHGTVLVVTSLQGVRWEVIVSPDTSQQKIVVVSAYPDP